MATRTSKTAKRQEVNGMFIMPELSVRDTDVKYTGGEPLFASQPDQDRRAGALAVAFNWYSKYFDRKMAKEQLALYTENVVAENITPSMGKKLRQVDDKELIPTYGWLARLAMRGLILNTEENFRLSNEIGRLLKTVYKPEVTQPVEEKTNRPNVQEIMRQRAHEAAGDLEGQLDDFVLSGAKANNIVANPVGVLTERSVLPQHIGIIAEVWKKKLNEFNDVLKGKDAQLVEAYSHYSKHQIKAIIKFIESLLAGFDSYINVKKASKAPRKRKAVSPEKQVSKIKFLKTFDELKLVSIHPAKLLGSTEVWAYDTAKRKIHYYLADSHVGTLGVKGATILGFDTNKSGVKTVRKPAEFLKKLMSAGKPASRKLFTDINAVQAQPNGRTNENLIILKVY